MTLRQDTSKIAVVHCTDRVVTDNPRASTRLATKEDGMEDGHDSDKNSIGTTIKDAREWLDKREQVGKEKDCRIDSASWGTPNEENIIALGDSEMDKTRHNIGQINLVETESRNKTKTRGNAREGNINKLEEDKVDQGSDKDKVSPPRDDLVNKI